MKELIKKVEQWFVDRNLHTLNGAGQLVKLTEEENLLVRIKFIVDMYSSGATSAEGALDQILNLVEQEPGLACPYCELELTKVSTGRYTCETEGCFGYLSNFMVLQ